MRIAFCSSFALFACGLAIVGCQVRVIGQSKSSPKVLEDLVEAHKREIAEGQRLWQPVAAAMASGDVKRTRAAVAAYLSVGGQLGRSRIELGRFYLAKGDLLDAKSELDHVVDPFDPLVKSNMPRRARTVGACDAEAVCLWQTAAVNSPESEKRAVLKRWYENYASYGIKPVKAYLELLRNPEALTEHEAGQWCLGSKATYGEAVRHYRKAAALAPTSLTAMKSLAFALRFNGEMEEAKVVAVKAWLLSDNQMERQGILWGAHLTLAEAKKIAGAGKP